MAKVRFSAKLLPEDDWVSNSSSDVFRYVGTLILHYVIPCVLVFLAYMLAARVVVICAKIQSIYAANSPVNQGVTKLLCFWVTASAHK